jgi:hypothetical protein
MATRTKGHRQPSASQAANSAALIEWSLPSTQQSTFGMIPPCLVGRSANRHAVYSSPSPRMMRARLAQSLSAESRLA